MFLTGSEEWRLWDVDGRKEDVKKKGYKKKKGRQEEKKAIRTGDKKEIRLRGRKENMVSE